MAAPVLSLDSLRLPVGLGLPRPFVEQATAFGALTQRPPPGSGPAEAVLALPALGSVAEDVLLRHIQQTAGDGLDGAAVWRNRFRTRAMESGDQMAVPLGSAAVQPSPCPAPTPGEEWPSQPLVTAARGWTWAARGHGVTSEDVEGGAATVFLTEASLAVQDNVLATYVTDTIPELVVHVQLTGSAGRHVLVFCRHWAYREVHAGAGATPFACATVGQDSYARAALLAVQGYPSAWVDLVAPGAVRQARLRPRVALRVVGHTSAACTTLLERACEVGDAVRLLDSWPERMRQRGAPAVWLAFADAVQAVVQAVRRVVHDRYEDDADRPTTAVSMVDLTLLMERLALRIAPLVAAATDADATTASLATLLDTLLRHGDGAVTDAATQSVARAVALHTIRPWLRALDAWTRDGLLPAHRHDFCVMDDIRGAAPSDTSDRVRVELDQVPALFRPLSDALLAAGRSARLRRRLHDLYGTGLPVPPNDAPAVDPTGVSMLAMATGLAAVTIAAPAPAEPACLPASLQLYHNVAEQVHARLRTHGQIILEAIRGPGELARALHIFHGLFFWSDMNFATRMHDVLAALPLAAVAWTPKAVCLELVRALPSSTETLPMVKVAFKAGMVETGAPRAAVPLLVALGQVTLAVIPPWPLALVLQAEHRRQYARVFHLLLRLKLAALVAQSASIKRQAMPTVVALFHFRVQRFLRALQGYLVDVAVAVPWSETVRAIDAAVTLEGAAAAHAQGLERLLAWCFLSPAEDRIRRTVDGLIGLVVQTFAVADALPGTLDAGEDVVWDATRAQLRARLVARTEEAQARFDSGYQALVDALLVRTRQGPSDHLDELLVRLSG